MYLVPRKSIYLRFYSNISYVAAVIIPIQNKELVLNTTISDLMGYIAHYSWLMLEFPRLISQRIIESVIHLGQRKLTLVYPGYIIDLSNRRWAWRRVLRRLKHGKKFAVVEIKMFICSLKLIRKTSRHNLTLNIWNAQEIGRYLCKN